MAFSTATMEWDLTLDSAFDLLPKMERAAKIHVDGEPLARNQLIGEPLLPAPGFLEDVTERCAGWYVFRMTGEERRRKQVMSRLQVLNCTTCARFLLSLS